MSGPIPASSEVMPTQVHDQPLPLDPTSPPVAIADGVDAASKTPKAPLPPAALDIEHLQVDDDPRLWSPQKKNIVLAVIAFTSMGGTITANIFFPAIASLQADLHASPGLVAASVSIYILGQGLFSMVWSGISEIKGRKACYIAALLLYCTGTAVCSRAKTMDVFIGMRVLQPVGSSAPLSIGAGTLADIFDNHERGTKLGIYYAVPLVGTSCGSLLGGALTTSASWRVTFYFLLGYGVICLILMIWLPETYRKERSLAWRLAMKRARMHAKEKLEKARADLPQNEVEVPERTPRTAFAAPSPSQLERGAPPPPTFPGVTRILTQLSLRSGEDNVKIHFRDVNPLAAVGQVFSERQNLLAIIYSGWLFASQYCINFTSSLTFAAKPYNYGPLLVGVVLLSFGIGNMVGSVLGGRYSDYIFNRLKAKNGGVGEPEMRIRSTFLAMSIMPPFVIIFGWVVDKGTPVYWPVIALFVTGLATIWIYTSILAYVVDANPGRSSSAVSCNSCFRGVFAAAASQAASPIIDKIGQGWFCTGFAVTLGVGQLALVVVGYKGTEWRAAKAKEGEEKAAKAKELEAAHTDAYR